MSYTHLGGGPRPDVACQLRDSLDGLDPQINVAVQGVQERAVIQQLGRYEGDLCSCPARMCLCTRRNAGKRLKHIYV